MNVNLSNAATAAGMYTPFNPHQQSVPNPTTLSMLYNQNALLQHPTYPSNQQTSSLLNTSALSTVTQTNGRASPSVTAAASTSASTAGGVAPQPYVAGMRL